MRSGKVGDGFQGAVVARQIAESQFSRGVCALDVIHDAFRRVGGFIKRDLRNAMPADRAFQYVRVIEFEQCSPFFIPSPPYGARTVGRLLRIKPVFRLNLYGLKFQQAHQAGLRTSRLGDVFSLGVVHFNFR